MTDDFIQRQGVAFLAHLLGRLHDDFVRGFSEWNREVGIQAPPRTHSTMRALHEIGPMAVTEIAALLRQSHPLVITWVRTLKELGFVRSEDDPADGRRTVLSLTPAGADELHRQLAAETITIKTIDRLLGQSGRGLFDSLWTMERELRSMPFIDRLRQESDLPADDPG